MNSHKSPQKKAELGVGNDVRPKSGSAGYSGRTQEKLNARSGHSGGVARSTEKERLDESPHWCAELEALKGMQFDSLEDAIREIAERICLRLGIGYDVEARGVVENSIITDPELCELVKKSVQVRQIRSD